MKVSWQFEGNKFPVDKKVLLQIIEKILKEKNIKGKIELGVNIVDDKKMKKLNESYMKKKGTTDVLSFSLNKEKGPDEIIRLGDIVINIEQTKRQAKEKKVKVKKELEFLLEHGLLHLLGFHHK